MDNQEARSEDVDPFEDEETFDNDTSEVDECEACQ